MGWQPARLQYTERVLSRWDDRTRRDTDRPRYLGDYEFSSRSENMDVIVVDGGLLHSGYF